MTQKTIKKKICTTGIGLHTGKKIKFCIEPLAENNGIIFYRNDKGISIPLSPTNVINTKLATTIGTKNISISTIEHLMSAIYAFGIDNLKITLNGPEIPIMDGSAISFVMMIKEAGIFFQTAPKKIMKITKTIKIEKDNKYVEISPSNNKTIFDFEIYFDHPLIKKQHERFIFSTENYIKKIARARTFGFLKEIQYLRSMGLALGGSLDNAIVLDDKGILNDSLRFPNEFIKHKILDAIGDMSLLKYNFIGEYKSFAGGHYLNHLLTLKILEEKAYEIITLKNTKKQKENIFSFTS